jgi:hypothetical protein
MRHNETAVPMKVQITNTEQYLVRDRRSESPDRAVRPSTLLCLRPEITWSTCCYLCDELSDFITSRKRSPNMKIIITTILHVLAVAMITFSVFGPIDWIFNIHEPELLLQVGQALLLLGFASFYLTYAVLLKEGWKNKDLKEFKILGLF